MKIQLFSVGREKADPMSRLVNEYLGRVGKFLPVSATVLKTNNDLEQRCQKSDKTIIVAMDERGKQFSSENFATLFSRWLGSGKQYMIFAIGAADGLPDSIRQNADLVLGLSQMTLPHRMARLFLCEQIYRALCIINHVPYHK